MSQLPGAHPSNSLSPTAQGWHGHFAPWAVLRELRNRQKIPPQASTWAIHPAEVVCVVEPGACYHNSRCPLWLRPLVGQWAPLDDTCMSCMAPCMPCMSGTGSGQCHGRTVRSGPKRLCAYDTLVQQRAMQHVTRSMAPGKDETKGTAHPYPGRSLRPAHWEACCMLPGESRPLDPTVREPQGEPGPATALLHEQRCQCLEIQHKLSCLRWASAMGVGTPRAGRPAEAPQLGNSQALQAKARGPCPSPEYRG